MESDWHIGSGTGRPGEVNRLMRRDDDDLPFVPAKTLTGIWRDACERVAFGLDDGVPGTWSQWIPFLFGEQPGQPGEELQPKSPDIFQHPRAAALSLRSARLPQPLRQALAGDSRTAVRDAVTFLKPGVKIDSWTGRARDKHLRFEEMGRIGAVLEADCTIDWGSCNDEEKRAATALLLAGTKFVERIGGKRRRGAGRCTLSILDNQELEPALSVLDSLKHPPAPPQAPTLNAKAAALSFESATGKWKRYSLEVITRSPVVISTRTVGNQVETADYLPGTYLLAILRRKLKGTGVNLDAAIINSNLLVTNATIKTGGNQGRPTPFALCREKLGGSFAKGGLYNRLCDELDFQKKTPQVKNYREGYVGATTADALPSYKTVKRQVVTHNVVLDAKQRPEEDVGGVYSYQAIKAGQELRTELRLKDSLVAALEKADSHWLQLLLGEHRIGRSKKDEYGVIEVTAAKLIDEDSDVAKQEKTEPSKVEDKLLTVWLLSDLLLRDERLRPTASIEHLQKELEGKLKDTGLELELCDVGTRNLFSSVTRQNRTESWQVNWGCPRPTLAGLGAGSCVVFEITKGELDDKTKSALAHIEAEGLGERRAEGYGQVCFNDPLLTAKLEGLLGSVSGNGSSAPNQSVFLLPTSDTFNYARSIEREAVRCEIARQALAVADKLENRTNALGIKINAKEKEKSQPPLSQLGALRSVINRMQTGSDSDKKKSNDWLEQLQNTDNRAEKWPDWKNKETGSLQKIHDLVNNAECVWSLLPIEWSDLVITETGQRDLKGELWAEAVRALVDACVRKQKREVEKLQQAR
ncbi:MAG TPA: RAMP superfamily CRISPR-associated protein [Blastocatellia bacterium]|nr:RAMP superfamily CRISPR-associated protein [Blastocatellia bacterium]